MILPRGRASKPSRPGNRAHNSVSRRRSATRSGVSAAGYVYGSRPVAAQTRRQSSLGSPRCQRVIARQHERSDAESPGIDSEFLTAAWLLHGIASVGGIMNDKKRSDSKGKQRAPSGKQNGSAGKERSSSEPARSRSAESSSGRKAQAGARR